MALLSFRRLHALFTRAKKVFLGTVKTPTSVRNANSKMVLVNKTLVSEEALAITPLNVSKLIVRMFGPSCRREILKSLLSISSEGRTLINIKSVVSKEI